MTTEFNKRAEFDALMAAEKEAEIQRLRSSVDDYILKERSPKVPLYIFRYSRLFEPMYQLILCVEVVNGQT